ncbi:MAG: SGNH/GDSL hydrolase family protein [Lachnospiraceae bacterium]|nr:SGNH/GDSL hydrolase family protein [Lachnospiraceae bacterium]
MGMLKWLSKKNIIRYTIALLLVAVLVSVSFYEKKGSKQYDIVILGDSVVGNIWGEINVKSVLEERTGKAVFNGAFGGSCMSMPKQNLWGSMVSTEWCMVKLAEAICYRDWNSQLAVVAYADSYRDVNTLALDYFAERMEDLSQLDFSQVEVLVIEHGTNDYNNGRPVDNPENPYDVNTFGGALRYSLSLLQEHYPNLRIVILSPIYCALGENRDKQCYNTSYGEGSILDDYVALEKEIAEEYGVGWIDAYHGSGIWEDNVDVYMGDALHPRMIGHELLANMIADHLEQVAD